MKRMLLFVVAAFLLAGACAVAEIGDSSANGFTFKMTINIQAPPDTVYKQFFAIGNWWNPSHTYSDDAHNLSIEEKAPGCWCEKLPNGGGVRHMEVVLLVPGKTIVLRGGLGPLQSIAATGAMKISLFPATGGTRLDIRYSVGGYLPTGMNTLAEPVDEVLTEQFTRFKSYVETGSPTPKKK